MLDEHLCTATSTLNASLILIFNKIVHILNGLQGDKNTTKTDPHLGIGTFFPW
jgi:hypothetical protein